MGHSVSLADLPSSVLLQPAEVAASGYMPGNLLPEVVWQLQDCRLLQIGTCSSVRR